MSLRTVYIIVYLGLLGFLVFLAFRPVIDLHSGAGVETSARTAKQAAASLMLELGIDLTDEFIPLVSRQQRAYLYTDLVDSLGRADNRNPAALNRSGIPLGGWSVTYLRQYERLSAILGEESLFDEFGLAAVSFDNELRVRSFRVNGQSANVSFTDSTLTGALQQVMRISGFNPELYVLDSDELSEVVEYRTVSSAQVPHTLRFSRSVTGVRTPEHVYLTFLIEAPEAGSEEMPETEVSIRLTRIFSSYTVLDKDTPLPSEFSILQFLTAFFSMSVWIILLLVYSGRLIFRGEVIWYRSLIVSFSVVTLLMVHRYLSMQNYYYVLFSPTVVGLDLLFYTATALAVGLFTGMAYLIWDAYARRQDHEQIPHIDAIWNRNLFQKKIGKAIIAGYGYAGLALGLFALGLYSFGGIFTISDDTFGFTSISSTFPVLTNLINSMSYVPIVAYAFVGVTFSIAQAWVRQSWIVILISTAITAVFLGFSVTFVTVSGSLPNVYVAFLLLSFPLILAYKYYGVITTGVALWIIFLAVRLGAFLGSSDQVLLIQGYVLSILVMVPFVIGFVLHHFGREDLTAKDFVPEYESRIKQQLRIEREFQIAKESQFAMMPKAAPTVPGVDVKGFFIPSYEVGGDFYDHVVIRNPQDEPVEIMFTVVDVSGKAMKAALTAIFTSGLLLSNSREEGVDPADVLTGINPILYERTDNQSFITCLLARYELETRMLNVVNAGHCQPLLKRKGKAEWLKTRDPRLPLGIRPNVSYVSSHVQMEEGDLLMLFSDGLPEARSKHGGIYEFETVRRVLEEMNTDVMSAEQICEYFKQEILRFSDYELADDMTVVVLRI